MFGCPGRLCASLSASPRSLRVQPGGKEEALSSTPPVHTPPLPSVVYVVVFMSPPWPASAALISSSRVQF